MSWRAGEEYPKPEDLRRVRRRLNRLDWARSLTREQIAAKYGQNPDRMAGFIISLLERLEAIGDDLLFEWDDAPQPNHDDEV